MPPEPVVAPPAPVVAPPVPVVAPPVPVVAPPLPVPAPPADPVVVVELDAPPVPVAVVVAPPVGPQSEVVALPEPHAAESRAARAASGAVRRATSDMDPPRFRGAPSPLAPERSSAVDAARAAS
jgi:hypothetical protein